MLRHRTLACMAALLVPASAHALSQPDGTVIPITNQLPDLFTAAGDAIDAVNDAADVPETFDPSCNLTFTLVSRGGAAFQNVFGWYNVTAAAPALSDLHVLIPCDAKPPSAFPLAIKNDPAYKGGKIGFFLITPEGKSSYCASTSNVGYVYYSEKAHNPDNKGAGSYIHLLIYDSKKYAKSFYFAWEDLFGGGDNEFTDFVARVDGITCDGGGTPCMTGQPGLCSEGVTECQNGKLTCVPLVKPSAEKCDGVDNDCNGKPDDGSGLCPVGQICEQGHCVPPCDSGEFQCLGNSTCDKSGHCVDPMCTTVTCPEGKVCTAGKCVGACDGIVCPHGQDCRSGVCVDPCTGVTCEKDQSCVGGACVETCACTGCAMGMSCAPSGVCVVPACATKTCAAGQYCAPDGTCTDSCAAAACPGGGACMMGICQLPKPGSGGAGGSFTGAGGGKGGAGGGKGGVSGAAGNKPTTTGGAAGTGGGNALSSATPDDSTTASSPGCGCRVDANGAASPWLIAAIAAMPLLARRRRRG